MQGLPEEVSLSLSLLRGAAVSSQSGQVSGKEKRAWTRGFSDSANLSVQPSKPQRNSESPSRALAPGPLSPPGIEQLLHVVRPGGWVLLRHARNEGVAGSFRNGPPAPSKCVYSSPSLSEKGPRSEKAMHRPPPRGNPKRGILP